jgi:uncharacterized membrane protein
MAESFLSRLREDPATKDLLGALGSFAGAQAGHMVSGAAAKFAGEDSATSGAVEGATDAASEGRSTLWGGIKGAFKKMVGGSAKRPTNIYEQLFVGVPVEQAFEEWTNYAQFPEFMKGPEKVTVDEEEGDDGEAKQTSQWTAKIFLNRRSWKATVEEQVENRRIRWSTEAAKGTIDGCITFTPIGDNATLILYTLEYRPKGFFEWMGNRWRTVGRRARLDVKHFGRHLMMLPAPENEEEQPDEMDREDSAGVGEQDGLQAQSEAGDGEERGSEGEAQEQGEAEPEDEIDDGAGDAGQSEDAEEPKQPRRRGPDRQPRKPREPRPPRD